MNTDSVRGPFNHGPLCPKSRNLPEPYPHTNGLMLQWPLRWRCSLVISLNPIFKSVSAYRNSSRDCLLRYLPAAENLHHWWGDDCIWGEKWGRGIKVKCTSGRTLCSAWVQNPWCFSHCTNSLWHPAKVSLPITFTVVNCKSQCSTVPSMHQSVVPSCKMGGCWWQSPMQQL